MAIRILDTLTLNNVEYHFTVPAWLQSFAISHIYGEYDYGDTNANYTIYASEPNTYPFSFRYSAGGFPSGNPSGSRVESGVAGTYFQFTSEYVPSGLVPILNNVQVMNWNTGGYYNYSVISWFFGIDDDTQQGYMWRFIAGYTRNVSPDNCAGKLLGIYPLTSAGDMYTFLKGLEPIVYDWHSVASVIGPYGQSNFTELEYPTDGSAKALRPASDFSRISYETSVKELTAPIVYGQWVDAVWSGENVLRIKWNNSLNFDVMFAVNTAVGQPTLTINYSLQNTNDDWYVMLLMDTSEGRHMMRPSFVYLDSQNGTFSYNGENITDAQAEVLYEWLVFNYNGDSVFGEPNTGGGGGRGNQIIEDAIGAPALPTLDALDTGWTKMYLFENTEQSTAVKKLQDLADWMDDFWENFYNYIFENDPMQALIGVSLSAIKIPSLNTSDNQIVSFLGTDTQVRAKLVSSQFFEVDCGEVLIDYPSNHTYLDFAPYTKIKAVLPFVGSIDLNTDDIMGRKLNLKYVCDALSGVCTAYIYVYTNKGWSLHYQKDGCFMIAVPFTKTDFTQQINAYMNGIASVAKSVITLGASAGMSSGGETGSSIGKSMAAHAGNSLVDTAVDMLMAHPIYQYFEGSNSGVSNYMGLDKPYLLVERPTIARPADDEKFIGMPSYITGLVGDFEGYTKFNEVHLEDCFCTGKEYNMIMQYLIEGIIIQSDGTPTPTPTPSTGNSAIVFIKNKSELNVMGKKWTDTYTIEGKLVYDQSIESPVFLISGDVQGYNYAYIPLFNRFYFIDDIICTRQTMEEVHFSVDPLQSFKDAIGNSKGIALRSADPNKVNYYINDGALMVQQNLQVQTVRFKKNGVNFVFPRSECGYVVILSNVNSHGTT